MYEPIGPPSLPDESKPASTLSMLPLAIVIAAIAAGVGGWGVHLILTSTRMYIPLIPGAAAGVAISKICRTNNLAICSVAAFFGFAGMVFGDALGAELVGTWNYLTNFWEHATLLTAAFWLANAAIGYWFASTNPATQA